MDEKLAKLFVDSRKSSYRNWPHLFHCLQLRYPTQNKLAGNKSTIIVNVKQTDVFLITQ